MLSEGAKICSPNPIILWEQTNMTVFNNQSKTIINTTLQNHGDIYIFPRSRLQVGNFIQTSAGKTIFYSPFEPIQAATLSLMGTIELFHVVNISSGCYSLFQGQIVKYEATFMKNNWNTAKLIVYPTNITVCL